MLFKQIFKNLSFFLCFFNLFFNPSHNQIHDKIDFLCGKWAAFWNFVPLFKASAAASGGGVLGDENRVVFHGGLLSIIFWVCGCKARGDEIVGMFSNCIHTFFFHIFNVFCFQRKFCTKRRCRKST